MNFQNNFFQVSIKTKPSTNRTSVNTAKNNSSKNAENFQYNRKVFENNQKTEHKQNLTANVMPTRTVNNKSANFEKTSSDVLLPCSHCGRSFREEIKSRHETICKRVFFGKRKVLKFHTRYEWVFTEVRPEQVFC